MKNIKIEKNLVGEEWWKDFPAVFIEGDARAAELPKDLSQAEKEAIIQSWKTVAILKASPSNIPFHVGFAVEGLVQFLKFPLETAEGMFGMRVGGGNVTFFVFPADLSASMKLELIEVTEEDDSRYENIPLY